MIGGPSFFDVAKDITFSHAAAVVDATADTPRHRFLAACLRLEAAGQEEGATCRRIYAKSDLADEIALPDASAAARIIRILTSIEAVEARTGAAAREGILAICALLAPPLGDA